MSCRPGSSASSATSSCASRRPSARRPRPASRRSPRCARSSCMGSCTCSATITRSTTGEMLARQDELSAVLPPAVTPASRCGTVSSHAGGRSVAGCSPRRALPPPSPSAAACGHRGRRSSRCPAGPLAAVDLADGRALVASSAERSGSRSTTARRCPGRRPPRAPARPAPVGRPARAAGGSASRPSSPPRSERPPWRSRPGSPARPRPRSRRRTRSRTAGALPRRSVRPAPPPGRRAAAEPSCGDRRPAPSATHRATGDATAGGRQRPVRRGRAAGPAAAPRAAVRARPVTNVCQTGSDERSLTHAGPARAVRAGMRGARARLRAVLAVPGRRRARRRGRPGVRGRQRRERLVRPHHLRRAHAPA